MTVPFPTGEDLRTQLRGSACLAAEAEVNGETEGQTLERLVRIADAARVHWLLAQVKTTER